MQLNRARQVLRIVGGSGIVLALVGLSYIALYLSFDYSARPEPLYFYQAWHVMASINAALLVCGLLLGISLLRGRVRFVPAFVLLKAVVVVFSFLPGFFWLNPRYGSSIAAASGISGGIVVEIVVLFPIWGSIAAIAAARCIRKAEVEATYA